MTFSTETERYGRVSIMLHWLTALLIVAVYAAIEMREFWPRGTATREMLKTWHFMLGLSIFGLVWLRIVARLIWPAPAPMEGRRWMQGAATATHFALYLLMFAMPLAGWLILSAEGKAVPFFGFELPPLAPANKSLAETVEEFHELGGTIGYWLIGLHTTASLLHHYVLKDKLLARMRL